MGRGRSGRGMRSKNKPARYFDHNPVVSSQNQNIGNELEMLRNQNMIPGSCNMLEFAKYYDSQTYYDQPPYQPGSSWMYETNQVCEIYETPDYVSTTSNKRRRLQPNEWSSTNYGETSAAQMLGPRPVPRAIRGRTYPAPSTSQFADRQEPSPKRVRADTTTSLRNPQNAIETAKKVEKVETSVSLEDQTLRSDREPSTALNGLLELGLGFILKQMKLNYANSPVYKDMVTREYYLRKLKKMLRERIRSVMMDKYIANYVFVVDEYRKKYPKKSDVELLKKVKSGPATENLKTFEDGKFNLKTAKASQTFFRKNIRNVAKATLREMFQKIIDMYNNEVEDPQMVEFRSKAMANASKKGKQKPSKWNIDLYEVIEKRFLSRFGKYMPTINRILNFVPEFKKEQMDLLAAAMKRDPTMPSNIKANIKTPNDAEVIDLVTEPEIYTATVRGVPKLPPQSLMRPFLNSYQPKKIKTHKKVKNILIVNFIDKESYDNFLKQNGKSIGDVNLEIKVGAILGKNPAAVQNSEENNTEGDNTAPKNPNDETISPSEIDSRINDLLSFIRQAEEETRNKAENQGVNDDNEASAVNNEPQNVDSDNKASPQPSDEAEVKSNAANETEGGDEEVTEEGEVFIGEAACCG